MRGIVDGVGRSGARLVMGDNLYMYGPTGGQPLREDMPYTATGRKGKTRAEIARMVLDAHKTGQIRATIGRASDFYGPRVRGSAVGETFFEPAIEGGVVNVMGNPDLPHTYTYIRDFARGLVNLSEQEIAFGRAWHVASDETITTRQFADLVAEEVDRPVRLRPAGKMMLAVVGLFVKDVRELRE
ncbi:MAG: GDP-mannose 4,6-dehydratase [Chloroflexota bacterium]